MSIALGATRTRLTLVHPTVRDSDLTTDRRAHPRLTLSDLEWLNTVRLKYGPVVSLIDLSVGGAQIETASQLFPGGVVVVQICGSDGEVALPSSVLRCHVSRVAPSTMYRSALAFKRPFEAPGRRLDRESDVVANLVAEHARMTGALRRLSHATAGTSQITSTLDGILTSTLTLIQSPAGRRADARFRRHLTQVFRELTQAIESGAEPDVILDRLADRLRRSVPTQVVRFADDKTAVGPHGPDTIYFDATSDGAVIARLIVEFPADCQLEEWHLQFLRIAAQLVALVSEVAALREASPAETTADPASTSSAVPSAPPALPFDALAPAPVHAAVVTDSAAPLSTVWLPVVARYTDGRMLKGYCRGFIPSRGYLSVSSMPDAPQSSISTVLLRHLKAVFFVHDLERAPASIGPTPAARGRSIVVTFMDGEVVSGTTLNYAVDGGGFFLSPHDERTNNVRMFVVHDAVRHVQFP